MEHFINTRANIRSKLFKNKSFHKEIASEFAVRHFKNPDKNKITKLRSMVRQGSDVEHLMIALEPCPSKIVQMFYRYEDEIDEITELYNRAKEWFPEYEKLIHYKINHHMVSSVFEHEDLFQDMYMVYLKTVATYNSEHKFSTQLGRNIDFELNNKYRKKKHEIKSHIMPIDDAYHISHQIDPYPIETDLMDIAKKNNKFKPLHHLLIKEMLIKGKNGHDITKEFGLSASVISRHKKTILTELQKSEAVKELLNKTQDK